MPSLPIFYATRDGQSRRIAEHIAAHLSASGAHAVDLASSPLTPETIRDLPVFVLIAPIRYGWHVREAELALDVYARLANKPPLALASVNLTARKPDKRDAATNPYLRKWIKRRRLTPALAVAIAGRLDYPRYSLFDRLAIQLIMTITGGVTDPTAVIEYTDWPAVDAFAAEIGDRTLECTPKVRQVKWGTVLWRRTDGEEAACVQPGAEAFDCEADAGRRAG